MRYVDLFEGFSDVNRQKIVHRMVLYMVKNRPWCVKTRKLGKWSDDAYNWVDDYLGDPNYPNGFAKWLPDNYPRPPEDVKQLWLARDESIIDTPWFRQVMILWANERYDEVIQKLKHLAGRPILAHRFIRTTLEKFSQAKISGHTDLGIHWTWSIGDWDGAGAVWGDGGTEFLIEAVIPEQSIDWTLTIMANMDYYSGDRENELRLIPGGEVFVRSITDADSEKPIPIDLTGVRFTA